MWRESNDLSFEIKEGDLDQDEDNIFVMPDGKTYGAVSPCWWEEKNGLQRERRNLTRELREKEARMCELEQKLCEKEDLISALTQITIKYEDRLKYSEQKLCEKEDLISVLTQKMENMKIN
jgi:uncharacterized coiled-coil protein SlyX